MAESLLPSLHLRDARLASHATSANPAWVWQADGRLLWANVTALDLIGAESPAGLTGQAIDPNDPVAGEIARLAETLPANGSPRLAPLHLPADEQQQPAMYLCARIILDDATPAVLAIATDGVRQALPLAERVRRLLADTDAPLAAFAPDGNLVYATETAAACLGGLTTLASLGAGLLGTEAIAKGHAEGRTPLGTLRIDRIGRDSSTVLLTTFPVAQKAAPTAALEPVADAAARPHQPAPKSAASPPDTAPDRRAPAAPERRPPLRFVWQMDPEGRFTVASEAFAALIGRDSAAMLGQPWIEIARTLGLDPGEQISRAIDARETWSGINVSWPVDGSPERLAVEMSGLPMFDRERSYLGYRGFGVCRDAEKFMPRPGVEPLQRDGQPENIVPFRTAPGTDAKAPALSPVEHTAFQELGRQIGARLTGAAPAQPEAQAADPLAEAPSPDPVMPHDGARELMDRLPVGVLVYRINTPVYANRAFLKWSGDASLEAFNASGGLDRLFLESGVAGAQDGEARRLTLTAGPGNALAESRLFSILWEGERAHALAVVPAVSAETEADLQRLRRIAYEQRSMLDLSAAGIVYINRNGGIIRLNPSAEAMFGLTSKEAERKPLVELLAPDSQAVVNADFAALARGPGTRAPRREVAGKIRDGGNAALVMTLGRLAGSRGTFCAVFHDIGEWKRSEEHLLAAKQQAEEASRAKSDFLAKISHEIRTPLNAIIGFSEVMMEERLGPIENDRYRAYLKDIHGSGEHLVALLNDLLDLSKIEAGKLELTFDSVSLNDLTQQCVALMQPLANRGRVIIRTSLAPGLPPIVADARSVRQILLNLLSNSIKFTGAGGQVIVSTALGERDQTVLRVRDTGIGMSEKEIETALEPFRQIETSARGGSGGTGLGLPLTKALAEANRAAFAIRSAVNAGTLVEVAFPTAGTPARDL